MDWKGRTYDPSGARHAIYDRAELAGLEGVHPHTLKHTFCHAWLANGGDGGRSHKGDGGRSHKIVGWQSQAMVRRYASSTATERSGPRPLRDSGKPGKCMKNAATSKDYVGARARMACRDQPLPQPYRVGRPRRARGRWSPAPSWLRRAARWTSLLVAAGADSSQEANLRANRFRAPVRREGVPRPAGPTRDYQAWTGHLPVPGSEQHRPPQWLLRPVEEP